VSCLRTQHDSAVWESNLNHWTRSPTPSLLFQVVGSSKLLRLASLAKQATITVCVDDPGVASEMSQAAASLGATINVIIEVNVGQGRCGVEPGKPVVALAKHIVSLPHLVFKGIQTYQG